MSSFNSYQYPEGDPFSLPQDSSSLPVTPEQRQRVQDYLIEARNQGRIGQGELDQRLAAALIARNRAELDRTYADIQLNVAPTEPQGDPYGYAQGGIGYQQGGTAYPTYPPQGTGYTYQAPYPVPINYPAPTQGMGAARAAHFLGLVSMFVGPAIIYATTQKGTLSNREAARAFNFQLTMTVGMILAGFLENMTGIGIVAGVIGMMWFIGTLVGGFTVGTENGKLVDKFTVLKVLNDGKPTETYQIDVPKKNN